MNRQPEPSNQEVLAGLVERVTYHNAENGFCVLRAKARGHRDVVTVVGHAATIAARRVDQFAANTLPVIHEIQENGVTSLRGIARVLNARGVPNARGTPWSPVAVSNVIKRSIVGAPRPAA